MHAAASTWTSLEVAKLVAAVATPVAVVILGVYLKGIGSRIEDAQWANRKVTERRLDLFDEMAPRLNDLLCFFTFVGDFRAITPPRAVELKRELDKSFHVNRYLLGSALGDQYDAFMDTCFVIYEDVATRARPRTDPELQEAERGPADWNPDWADMLARPGEASSPSVVRQRYEALMAEFADEVGVSAPRG